MNGRDHAPASQDWRSRLERMVVEFPSETLEKAPFRGVANPKVGTIAANNTKPALVQAALSNFSSSPRTKNRVSLRLQRFCSEISRRDAHFCKQSTRVRVKRVANWPERSAIISPELNESINGRRRGGGFVFDGSRIVAEFREIQSSFGVQLRE